MTTAHRHYPNNLPIALSSFIGRGREIIEVKQLFSTTRPDGARLVSLTGPGGCGKTRLAIWVAAELGVDFSEGVWLVELAPVSNPDLAPQTVATALGLHEQPSRSLMTVLSEYLLSRELLLVLDNCEHLLGACAQIAETLLRVCPHIRILATSREPLNISGETVWTVPPLSFLEFSLRPGIAEDPLILLQYEAIRLFIERASAASSAFTLTNQNASAVAEICQRLDGMPLAIELAAARVRALSVQQIAERLDDRFRLLTGGSRTAPPRHQQLQATLDWSYALLLETERQVLQRLSVFAGGWTLEAAEAVCAIDGLEPGDVLDILSHLVDKSWVVVDKLEGQARYRLLETIRQYTHEKLAESGGTAGARDRHLDYFAGWAETANEHVNGPEQFFWLNRFESEHDNLRTALEWSRVSSNDAERGLRLAGAAGYFWGKRGYGSEGRTHLSAALAGAGSQTRTSARARALYSAAILAFLQSDYAMSRLLNEEGLAIWREQGPTGRAGVADGLEMLGEVATEEGDYAAATRLLEEALSIYQELRRPNGIAFALMQLGWAAMRTGQYERAAAQLEESLALLRKTGFTTSIMYAHALSGSGEVALRQGEFERATRLLQESLTLSRAHRDKWAMGTSLGSLGWVALCLREFKRMRALLRESLTARLETGDRGGSAWCLEKLAEAAVIQSQAQPPRLRSESLRRAVRVFAAAAAIRAPLKSVIDSADQPDYQRNLAHLRALLGETLFESAWAEGSALTLEQATAEALSEPELSSEISAQGGVGGAKESYGGLTRREQEVAAFIAQGKSNREIAEAMTVGLRTVETYISRIFNKLDVSSRVQIATWAVEKGLAPPSEAPDL